MHLFIIKTNNMTTLFYLLTILFIAYELMIIINPNILLNKFSSFNNTDYNIKVIKIDWFIAIHLLYTVWTIIGIIFSSQFLLFITLIIIGLLTYIFKKYSNKKQTSVLITMDAISCIIVLCVIFYKHFN